MACRTYEEEEKVYTGFWWGKLRERDQLEDPCADGRLILTLRLLMSYIYIHIHIYIYGAPSEARNADVVYIYIYGPTFGNAETVSFYLLHLVGLSCTYL